MINEKDILESLKGINEALKSVVNFNTFLKTTSLKEMSYLPGARATANYINNAFVSFNKVIGDQLSDTLKSEKLRSSQAINTAFSPVIKEYVEFTNTISNLILNNYDAAIKAKDPEADEIKDIVNTAIQSAADVAMKWFKVMQKRAEFTAQNPKLEPLKPLLFGDGSFALVGPKYKDLWTEEAFRKRGLTIQSSRQKKNDQKMEYRKLGFDI